MAIKYEAVVPWGRSYQEYRDMFHLTETDLTKKILGCGDGPAGFNAVMARQGRKVVSIDPLYQFDAAVIEKRIAETYQTVISQTRQNQDKFIWTQIKDVDALGKIRMAAMREFLADYPAGRQENRYLCAELPALPFGDAQFDLALSSHFLFLHADHLSLDFHLEAIREMLRVSREVRIFPLLDVNGIRCPHVDEVIAKYQRAGYHAAEVKVNYEFQKEGNRMLKIWRGEAA